MARWEIRPLRSEDFAPLMRLEEDVFGASGEKTLGPYYVRLCCEFFTDTCFIAFADGQPAGYVLCFLRGREAYCTTLAVTPRFQGTRLALRLVRTLIGAIAHRVDSCWFTVKEENSAARAIHAVLGAREVEVRKDFYEAGDDRIVSRIDRPAFDALRARMERLGLLPDEATLAAAKEDVA
jgi:ribosomal protein S18 acetylase RimI-like enzyme